MGDRRVWIVAAAVGFAVIWLTRYELHAGMAQRTVMLDRWTGSVFVLDGATWIETKRSKP